LSTPASRPARARARRAGQKAVGGARGKCARGSNGSHGPLAFVTAPMDLRWICERSMSHSTNVPVPQSITLGRSLFGSILGGHGRERGVASRINARVECGRRGGRRWPRRAAATRWVGEQANRRLQSMGKRTGPCLSWDARCAAVVASWRARTSDVSRAHAPTMAPLPRDGRRMDESLIARGAPESQSAKWQ
jgi:hypothetical protein